MFMSMNIKRNLLSVPTYFHFKSKLFLSWESGCDCFHMHCVKHVWPREWVWESNGSKLEGMCEWLYVHVCVYLPVKQYPEALQRSH